MEKMKRFKVISLLLAAVLTVSLPPVTVRAEDENEPAGETDLVEIGTAEEFAELARQCSLDSWSVNKRIVLTQDLDISGEDFIMIPVFAGTFDGGGHTISGFHSIGSGYVGGLFRYIEQGGKVVNLTLKGSAEGTEDRECIGSICGVNYGTIENCTFEGRLYGRDTVGGIAGTNGITGYIASCTARGHLSGYYTTGGIVGANHGTVAYCDNYLNINDDSAWVKESDQLSEDLLDTSVESRDIELFSGVDTGGIAGYSDGTIARCANYGTIGYEHIGYNTGGIAGRQNGIVSLCTNQGNVYGRKDIGGIVGQMEPHVEVDEAQSLRNAVNKLHDLIGRTLDDLKSGKDVMKSDMDALSSYGNQALDSGYALAGEISDFADTNIEQMNLLGDQIEYAKEQLNDIFDDNSAAAASYRSFHEKMQMLLKNMQSSTLSLMAVDAEETEYPIVSAEPADEPAADDPFLSEAGSLDQKIGDASAQAGQILSALTEDEPTSEDIASKTGELYTVLNNMKTYSVSMQDLVSTAALESNEQLLEDASAALSDMLSSLNAALSTLKGLFRYLNNQPDLTFASLGEEFDQSKADLNSQLHGISEALKSLGNNASNYSDQATDNLKAVNDQLNVVFNLLADQLSGSTDLSLEELYEEVSDEDLDSITTGRADGCRNKGIVKGDINIGGIAGSMSIDEEDPEDNAAGSIDYEVGRRFIMNCIIDGCVNEGYVTAKKDGAGGIVGYMRHGIVIRSEGYGSVESTEGDYAGGIAGESLTIIRSCYSLCDISGRKNIGGIAGYASTVKDCYAMVNADAESGKVGAIAGDSEVFREPSADEDFEICRNYYVGDTLWGIDNISYVGVAEPISYEDLLAVPDIPDEFRHLKVIYRVEDEYLGSEEVAYGESLDGLHYPEIPQKEGYYGVWPDHSGGVMGGNLVIDGEYHEIVPVVAGKENPGQEASSENTVEKPYVLAGSAFTEDTALEVSLEDTAPSGLNPNSEYVSYHVRLSDSGLGEDESIPVRLLNPYKKTELWMLSGGTWNKIDGAETKGSYLQTTMTGTEATFCLADQGAGAAAAVLAAVLAAAALLAMILTGKKIMGRKKKKTSPETTDSQ